MFTFDEKIAKKYGVNEAIMLQNIVFWIKKNKANNKHYYDNKFWTYNSVNAFAEIFSFWTVRQIRTILNSLIDQNAIIAGNYNENPFDQTRWYALSDELNNLYFYDSKNDVTKIKTAFDQNGNCTFDQNGNCTFDQNVKSLYITDINTDNKQQIINNNPLPPKLSIETKNGDIANACFVEIEKQKQKDFSDNREVLTKSACKLWHQLIKDNSYEFTNRELEAIEIYASFKPFLQAYQVIPLLKILNDSANKGLDIYTALLKSVEFKTTAIAQAFAHQLVNENGKKLSLAEVIDVRNKTVAYEKQQRIISEKKNG